MRNDNDNTAADLASRHGKEEIAEFLSEWVGEANFQDGMDVAPGDSVLSWTHTSTGTHLSTGHTLSVQKRLEFKQHAPATCDADAITFAG